MPPRGVVDMNTYSIALVQPDKGSETPNLDRGPCPSGVSSRTKQSNNHHLKQVVAQKTVPQQSRTEVRFFSTLLPLPAGPQWIPEGSSNL